jgi:beta-glucosidase
MTTSTEATEERSRVAALPVEEKVRLLTGADSWRTYGATALGLRPIVMSDGPAGVRGITKDDRNPSASLPCPSALGATWDSELVRELAAALGAEARGKGIDIVLAPTMNLMRTPLGGRGFECFSEDPVLSARLAVSYVTGVQSAGVGAAVKHYVGNDSETERWTYDARIAEAVLRELYLVPFEAAVREAGAAMVMAAYNAVNGARMTEHERLLHGVLKGEWGFTGAIVSDWDACRSVVPSALAGLDLAMPGPDSPWVTGLAEAVRAGQVPEEVIDEKVLRLLEVARQVGAVLPRGDDPPEPPEKSRAARRAAVSTAGADSSRAAAAVTRLTRSCASSMTTTSWSGRTGKSSSASIASRAWLVTTMSTWAACSRARSAKHSPPFGQRAAPMHSRALIATCRHARSSTPGTSSSRSPVSVSAAHSCSRWTCRPTADVAAGSKSVSPGSSGAPPFSRYRHR